MNLPPNIRVDLRVYGVGFGGLVRSRGGRACLQRRRLKMTMAKSECRYMRTLRAKVLLAEKEATSPRVERDEDEGPARTINRCLIICIIIPFAYWSTEPLLRASPGFLPPSASVFRESWFPLIILSIHLSVYRQLVLPTSIHWSVFPVIKKS